jgi:hypothetical protein
MNCRDFESIAMPLARGEPLEEAEREQGLNHAAGCPRCAVRLEAERRLTALFAEAAGAARACRAPARVERELRRSFRAQRLPRRTVSTWWGWAAWAAGAAAAVLLAAVLMLHAPLARRTAPKPPDTIERPSAPAAPVVAAAVARPQPKTARAVPGTRRVVRVNRDAEFLRLPYAPEEETAGDSYIARLSLSRATLAAAGLPMNMDRDEEAVEADVLVSEDGTARAVRIRQ